MEHFASQSCGIAGVYICFGHGTDMRVFVSFFHVQVGNTKMYLQNISQDECKVGDENRAELVEHKINNISVSLSSVLRFSFVFCLCFL